MFGLCPCILNGRICGVRGGVWEGGFLPNSLCWSLFRGLSLPNYHSFRSHYTLSFFSLVFSKTPRKTSRTPRISFTLRTLKTPGKQNTKCSKRPRNFTARNQGAAKGGRQKEFDHSFSLSGHFRSLFGYFFWRFCHFFRHFLARLLLPDSFCGTVKKDTKRTKTPRKRRTGHLKFENH